MSQIPPSPYGNPPPQQPYGQPPMQPPIQPPMPPYGQGYPPQPFGMPSKTSGAAIAALVLGLVGFCVPVIGGLVAVILGIVGIASTGTPNVKGRGMAISGLILGLLTLLGWGVMGGVVGVMFAKAAPDRAAARTFLTHVAAGDAAAAHADCVPNSVADQHVDQLIGQVQPMGALKDTTFFGMEIQAGNGQATAIVSGNAIFGTTAKQVTVTLVPNPGGTPLVQRWRYPVRRLPSRRVVLRWERHPWLACG